MVSANNLYPDVLDLIFSNLLVHDLSAVSLVSHSFFDAAIPHLYHTLFYRHGQAQCFNSIMSPFAVILIHPEYSAYVRKIDLRTVPVTKGKLNSKFARELEDTLKLCNSIRSFTCLWSIASFKMLDLISRSENKHHLQEIRISAADFTKEEANTLLNFNCIQNLSLAWSSWSVLNILPDWTRNIHDKLTTLTFYICVSLNDTILEMILRQLTRLSALHIMRCPNISSTSVLRLTTYTPALNSLTFDITDSIPSTLVPSSLPFLHQLRLHICSTDDQNQRNTASVLSYFRAIRASFSDICITGKTALHYSSIIEILHDYGPCLRKFACHSTLEMSCVNSICDNCPNLEELTIPILMHEFLIFVGAIRGLKMLRTLRDARTNFELHLTRDKVTHLMWMCRRLRCITSGDRIWTMTVDAGGNQHIQLGNYRTDAFWLESLSG